MDTKFSNVNTGNELLMDEVEKTLQRMRASENMLNFTHEPELVESAILEIEASRIRYNYLLKKLKQYYNSLS